MSTSTLELGIDVGDLDRVLQIDAPRSVASFLQRLGRTGRRAGVGRNALFLSTTDGALLQAAGLLRLWTRGYVEPITAPPSPRHIAAQQLLALCLQEGQVGENTWPQWWQGLPSFDTDGPEIAHWLVSSGHLERDSGMLFIGPEAERRYGRKNFLELLSVFAASPEFRVLHGRAELGSVDPLVLTRKVLNPRIVVLAGRSWMVTSVDWKRRRCFVEPSDVRASMGWSGATAPLSFALCRSERDVLLGADPEVTLSRRAVDALTDLRISRSSHITGQGTTVQRVDDVSWWTWAGARANATLASALSSISDPEQGYDNHRVRLRPDVTREEMAETTAALGDLSDVRADVNEDAVRGLKFSDVLPPPLARETVALRLTDRVHAEQVLAEPRHWRSP